MNRREFLKMTAMAAVPFIAPAVLEAAAPVEEPKVKEYFPTGIQAVDRILDGGIHKGHLGIIIGPCGCGKTAFLRHIRDLNFPDTETTYWGEGSCDALWMWDQTAVPLKLAWPPRTVVYPRAFSTLNPHILNPHMEDGKFIPGASLTCDCDRLGIDDAKWTRGMKRFAMDTNTACVVAMPAMRCHRGSSNDSCVVFSSSFERFRPADFVIAMHGRKGEICFDFIKNRHGRTGRVCVDVREFSKSASC